MIVFIRFINQSNQ